MFAMRLIVEMRDHTLRYCRDICTIHPALRGVGPHINNRMLYAFGGGVGTSGWRNEQERFISKMKRASSS